jgi:hypothetical protein
VLEEVSDRARLNRNRGKSKRIPRSNHCRRRLIINNDYANAKQGQQEISPHNIISKMRLQRSQQLGVRARLFHKYGSG